jgi:hypothetical protein
MNSEIRRGHRSKFVETAIRNRLEKVVEYDIYDLTTIRIVSHLRNSRFSELTELERTMLAGIVSRLEDSQ